MQLRIHGKNMQVSDWMESYVEKKLGKLDRYLPTINETRVELSVEPTKNAGDSQICQVTVHTKGTILRAEERASDMRDAIDSVGDKMYDEDAPQQIVRRKQFTLVPMGEEEAIEQMELLGHDFFLFFNVEVSQINLLYRRKDGHYGLLQPILA